MVMAHPVSPAIPEYQSQAGWWWWLFCGVFGVFVCLVAWFLFVFFLSFQILSKLVFFFFFSTKYRCHFETFFFFFSL